MSAPIRFWGRVISLRPRLVLTKFEETTEASCPGYILTLEGTTTEGAEPPVGKTFTVAIGPATMQNREIALGDLLRGDAHYVPEGLPDTPAELYKVGVLRLIARTETPITPDPPRTDPPLSPDAVEKAPRRALAIKCLLSEKGSCRDCSHAVLACVVRLTDPRNYRTGRWTQVPACLGPEDCRYFIPRED
ncbi:hypothetical protein [Armatimonas sp.]|uniref:hypothetical protein n=1 Tax=Armatimonas sp. TaxID=1872638 RepID=UPI00286C8358|nr:hypothetical protein [Armatimonas sp.]